MIWSWKERNERRKEYKISLRHGRLLGEYVKWYSEARMIYGELQMKCINKQIDINLFVAKHVVIINNIKREYC